MNDIPQRYRVPILEHRQLSETGFELTLERPPLTFKAGRLLTIHGREITEDRSYSIASGEQDEVLQVLYRYIPSGRLTPYLRELQAGDLLDISGPFGEFVLRDPDRPMVFVATGTGIAPCRSYVRSHANLDITIIQGAREDEDLFYRETFEPFTYHPCLSRQRGSEFPKRVTEVLAQLTIHDRMHFYLCGANEMIFDVHALLLERGVNDAHIFAEEYYYRFES